LLPEISRVVLLILIADFVAALLSIALTLAAVFYPPWLILSEILSWPAGPANVRPAGLTNVGSARLTDARRAWTA